jgi:hypothetical protein
MDCTDEEACLYADIAPSSLYNYQSKHPKFLERKQALRQRPVMLARIEVVRGIETSPQFAMRYLERKRPQEFGPKSYLQTEQKVELSSNESPEVQKLKDDFDRAYQKVLRDSWTIETK